MCGQLDDGNSADNDTRARSRGGFGGESPDRWIPAVNVGGAVTEGKPGSHAEMDRRCCRSRPTQWKTSCEAFPFLEFLPHLNFH
jgi:hypothetical protein